MTEPSRDSLEIHGAVETRSPWLVPGTSGWRHRKRLWTQHPLDTAVVVQLPLGRCPESEHEVHCLSWAWFVSTKMHQQHFNDLREVSIPNEPSKNVITTSLDNSFTTFTQYTSWSARVSGHRADFAQFNRYIFNEHCTLDLPMLWASMDNPPTDDQASEWSRVRTTLLDVCVSVPSTVGLNFAFFPPNTYDYPRLPSPNWCACVPPHGFESHDG